MLEYVSSLSVSCVFLAMMQTQTSDPRPQTGGALLFETRDIRFSLHYEAGFQNQTSSLSSSQFFICVTRQPQHDQQGLLRTPTSAISGGVAKPVGYSLTI